MTITNHSPINLPYTLVLLYRKFYRADSKYNPSTQSVLKPVITARETVKYTSLKDTEELVTAVAGAIEKDMRTIKSSRAKGFWVLQDESEQREAIFKFARFYVEKLFVENFKRDKSRLSSERSIGIIEDTIECLYRLEQDKENKLGKLEKKATEDYFGDYEWELSYPDENELLITGPGRLEILVELDNSKAKKVITDYSKELDQISVAYPIEESNIYCDDRVCIQVITTGNGVLNTANLHIGSKVSRAIPFEFARQLQTALLGTAPV